MLMKILVLWSVALMVPGIALSAQRTLPERPRTESLKVSFNAERISGYVLVIDVRTHQEQERDRIRGELAGPAIVFFEGHAQRPSDAYAFTSSLAMMSKSGMVIVPVCDTPYGKDASLRGDAGKDVILMEMVRWVLVSRGIGVKGYEPRVENEVLINNARIDTIHGGISAGLLPVGWSHGAILARRFAHAYPGSVGHLAQVCPAGYEHWSPAGLTLRFMGESLRITRLTLKGHARDTLGSAWGFTRGISGDFFRSIPAALMSLRPAAVLRVGRDIRDCSAYCDSSSLGAEGLERVVVIFGDDDTCMDIRRIMGLSSSGEITALQESVFRETFFGDVAGPDAALVLRVLPGTHLAPVTHSALYARTVLEGLGQVHDSL